MLPPLASGRLAACEAAMGTCDDCATEATLLAACELVAGAGTAEATLLAPAELEAGAGSALHTASSANVRGRLASRASNC